MRFIKRLIFVILLLVIAFFIYRLISPTAAKELLYDLKSFSNDKIGTHFSLSGEVIAETGVVLDITGTVLDDTGILEEMSGDEELLLNDSALPEESFSETGTVSVATAVVAPTPTPTPTSAPVPTSPKKPTTTSSNGLSTQDKRDAESMLGGFGN